MINDLRDRIFDWALRPVEGTTEETEMTMAVVNSIARGVLVLVGTVLGLIVSTMLAVWGLLELAELAWRVMLDSIDTSNTGGSNG